MDRERSRARVFGEVADDYDRVRPGYPTGLIDDMLSYASLEPGGRALEAGAGTGKATVAVAERGVAVTAVEPDAAMAAVLARRGHPDVVVSVFEEYRPARPFPLLFSAQAWHWMDPDRRWRHAADVLAPGGTIALFWNNDSIADFGVHAAIAAVHRRWAPQIEVSRVRAEESTLFRLWPRTDLARLADFGDLTERLYRSTRELSTVDYLTYLATQSSYRILDQPTRERLFLDVDAAVGDTVELAVDTILYLARRRPANRT